MCQRSSFGLREARIETTEWNAVGAEAPVRRVIPLEVVTSVVVSYRILRWVILTENRAVALGSTEPGCPSRCVDVAGRGKPAVLEQPALMHTVELTRNEVATGGCRPGLGC